jgi:lipopolysaccharide export system protein LptA
LNLQFTLLPLAVALFALALASPVAAQNFGGAFNGMRNSDEPVQIEADRLEVTDEQGIADFVGNVSVLQGTTLLKTKHLKVYYARGANAAPGPNGNVRKIEASGGVAVRSDDQKATADTATVDMQAQTAVLSGNVVISQGENVVTGCVLNVNLATNAAVLVPCRDSGTGRVKMRFTPKSGEGQ